MKPLKDYVVIRPRNRAKEEEERLGALGIATPPKKATAPSEGEVVAVGKNVEEVKAGDFVRFSPFYYDEFEDGLVCVREDEIYAILNDPTAT